MMASSAYLGGCGLPLTDAQTKIDNRCDRDDQCGDIGKCINQKCVSTSADLPNLLIQIDVPDGASYGEGTTQVVYPSNDRVPLSGQLSNGYFLPYDLHTSALTEVTARMILEPVPTACATAVSESDGTFPIQLQLHPTVQPDQLVLAGIPLPTYAVSSDIHEDSNQVVLNVPTGLYDIYITPSISLNPDETEDDPLQDCKVPPVFLPGQDIEQGQFVVELSATAPTTIIAKIDGYELTGWSMQFVDNSGGRVISTSAEQDPAASEPGTFRIEHWPQVLESDNIDPVLRLSPPTTEDNHLPTLLAKINPLLLGEDPMTGDILLSSLDLSPLAAIEPITVTGNVAAEDTSEAIPSKLVFQSLDLLDGDGVETFRSNVETQADGTFSIPLLPGKYAVIASPNGAQGYAMTRSEIELSTQDEGGKTLFVKLKRNLLGAAVTPLAGDAFDVQVLLAPALRPKGSFISSLLDSSAQPAATSTFTNQTGTFDLSVDPGEFDVTLQPDPSSQLPWAVVARLAISDIDNSPIPELSIALSNPVILSGKVRSPNDAPIPGAHIRAFIQPQKANEDDNPPVIQIGETTSDGAGSYELRLPASIGSSISQ